MGVFNGSISVTKFFVEGEVPKQFSQSYLKNIHLRRFTELTVDGEEEEASGWCVAGNGLDLDLRHEQIFLNSFIVLGLRVDRWRIPRHLFKAQFAEAATEYLARTGKDKLSKRDKDEIKFRVNRKLRKKVIPSMRQYDVCWDLNRQEVLFWCRTARTIDDLCVLFEKTFSLTLREASPYTVAGKLIGETEAEKLCELEQTLFATELATPAENVSE
jgi:recombination associated protein RdgC